MAFSLGLFAWWGWGNCAHRNLKAYCRSFSDRSHNRRRQPMGARRRIFCETHFDSRIWKRNCQAGQDLHYGNYYFKWRRYIPIHWSWNSCLAKGWNLLPEPGTLQFEKRGYLVKESCGDAEVAVIRQNGADGDISVKWRTIDKTAINGKDYHGGEGEVHFKHGEVHTA